MLNKKETLNVLEKDDNSSTDILESLIQKYGSATVAPTAVASGNSYLGEIIDTHHPDIPGRLFVRWQDENGHEQERWLMYCLSNGLYKGSKVLISQPANWSDCIVVAVLASSQPENRTKAIENTADQAPARLSIKASETIQVETESGKPLLQITHYDQGAVLRLGKNINLELPGTFRIDADRIELNSKQGGTDCRSDGEIVCRSPRIRLN